MLTLYFIFGPKSV